MKMVSFLWKQLKFMFLVVKFMTIRTNNSLYFLYHPMSHSGSLHHTYYLGPALSVGVQPSFWQNSPSCFWENRLKEKTGLEWDIQTSSDASFNSLGVLLKEMMLGAGPCPTLLLGKIEQLFWRSAPTSQGSNANIKSARCVQLSRTTQARWDPAPDTEKTLNEWTRFPGSSLTRRRCSS